MIRRINETLLELMIGILIAGLVFQIGELLLGIGYPQFAGRARMQYAIGLWAGILTAEGLAVHMYRSIDRALDMLPGDAEGYMRKAYLIRTVIILGAAGLVTYFIKSYVLATFLGVLCLKFGAFLQPLIHRIRIKMGLAEPDPIPQPMPEDESEMTEDPK